jgi:hypothetical protein
MSFRFVFLIITFFKGRSNKRNQQLLFAGWFKTNLIPWHFQTLNGSNPVEVFPAQKSKVSEPIDGVF